MMLSRDAGRFVSVKPVADRLIALLPDRIVTDGHRHELLDANLAHRTPVTDQRVNRDTCEFSDKEANDAER